MRNYLLENAKIETVVIKAKPLFFPVRFDLPEHLKESIPASLTRGYQGSIVMRFYCNPCAGDTIEYQGLIWRVMYLAHSPQRKGSSKGDSCPLVMVEYISTVE
jgi:hypothetical protein